MTAKRILLVDDQRDVTRMLRASLETLGHNYTIVDVPSGEEALLEIKRGGIDLLITDVRLPGISGLEVIKRLRKANNKAQIIVISGQATPEAATEARQLGVMFFTKPVPIGDFLDAVQKALGADEPASAPTAPQTSKEQPGIADRLARLRQDLGALAVFLVDLDGRIVVRAGDVSQLDMEPVLTHLMTAFSASMNVCKLLGGLIPMNVQYFDGDEYDIYSANVGRYFALVIIFDGDRGQMGPVMRYGRQCADDLLNSLVMMGVAQDAAPVALLPAAPAAVPVAPPMAPPAVNLAAKLAARLAPRPAAAPLPVAPPPPAPEPPPPAAPEPPPAPLTEAQLTALDSAAQQVNLEEALAFWDVAITQSDAPAGGRSDALTFDQAEKLGLVNKGK